MRTVHAYAELAYQGVKVKARLYVAGSGTRSLVYKIRNGVSYTLNRANFAMSLSRDTRYISFVEGL